jgi:hypothetical protein
MGKNLEIYWVIKEELLTDEEVRRRGKMFEARLEARERLRRDLLIAFELVDECQNYQRRGK